MPAEEHPDAADAVTWQVRVAAAWTWRMLVLGVGLYILGHIFIRIELVAVSFVLALFMTAILRPLERQFSRLVPAPKSISALLALLVGLAALGGIGWFVVWQITEHSSQLGDQITSFVNRTRNWLQTGPLHLKSADLAKLADNITNTVKSHQDQLITGAIATVRTVVEALGALLLILLSTFFLLRDGEQIWGWVVRLFPRAAHDRVDRAGRAGWGTFGGYMRGQLLIALFHGVAVTIVLLVVNVPLAAALGVVIFLGSFIPLVGLTVAGALCTAVALLEHGPGAAIAVAVAIVVLVQVESHLLQPYIMSRSVAVHPLAIALTVITGTTLAGIPGALLSVPFVAFLNSTVHALREEPVDQTGGGDVPVIETSATDEDPNSPSAPG
ncbi:MAG: AI-2E family transporter [Jatrophihabitantaceae bacterium]